MDELTRQMEISGEKGENAWFNHKVFKMTGKKKKNQEHNNLFFKVKWKFVWQTLVETL